MDWSVRDLLLFSQAPGIREALDGDTNINLYGAISDQTASGDSNISDDGG